MGSLGSVRWLAVPHRPEGLGWLGLESANRAVVWLHRGMPSVVAQSGSLVTVQQQRNSGGRWRPLRAREGACRRERARTQGGELNRRCLAETVAVERVLARAQREVRHSRPTDLGLAPKSGAPYARAREGGGIGHRGAQWGRAWETGSRLLVGCHNGRSGKMSDVNRVIAVSLDPGDDTGWSWFECRAEELLEGGIKGGVAHRSSCVWDSGFWLWGREGAGMGRVRWENWQARQFLALCRQVWEDAAVDPEKDVFVACVEQFRLRLLDSGDSLLSPVRITARIDLLFEGNGIRRAGFSAADAKHSSPNERLERWGLIPRDLGPVSGPMRHALDAERQGLLFLKKWYSDRMFRAGYPAGMYAVPNSSEVAS